MTHVSQFTRKILESLAPNLQLEAFPTGLTPVYDCKITALKRKGGGVVNTIYNRRKQCTHPGPETVQLTTSKYKKHCGQSSRHIEKKNSNKYQHSVPDHQGCRGWVRVQAAASNNHTDRPKLNREGWPFLKFTVLPLWTRHRTQLT